MSRRHGSTVSNWAPGRNNSDVDTTFTSRVALAYQVAA